MKLGDLELGRRFIRDGEDGTIYMRVKDIETFKKDYPGAVTAVRLEDYQIMLLSGSFEVIDVTLNREESDVLSCSFCEQFDFSKAKTEVDRYGARILLAVSNTMFLEGEQFNYCPVCGSDLKRIR